VRRFFFVNSRKGCAIRFSQSLTSSPVGGHDWIRSAKWAAMMLPPDTEEIVSTFDKMPSSLSRRRAPRWNKAALKPPPDKHNAMPVRRVFGSGKNPSMLCCDADCRSVTLGSTMVPTFAPCPTHVQLLCHQFVLRAWFIAMLTAGLEHGLGARVSEPCANLRIAPFSPVWNDVIEVQVVTRYPRRKPLPRVCWHAIRLLRSGDVHLEYPPLRLLQQCPLDRG
jgi:hypothetical protein